METYHNCHRHSYSGLRGYSCNVSINHSGHVGCLILLTDTCKMIVKRARKQTIKITAGVYRWITELGSIYQLLCYTD